MTAIRIGYTAFTDPESLANSLTAQGRVEGYSQAWFYYRHKMFSRRDGYDWTQYLSDRQLYKHTRLIYNPVPQIIDFYVDNLFQAANNETYPTLITDIADGVDESIYEAVAQVDQWTNWLSDSQKTKRYATVTGNVLIEVVDDLEREKVTQKTVWAGYVTELELNASGDVLSYTIEYSVYDTAEKKNYLFKKIVTKETFSYFRDGKAFVPQGKTEPVEENPYGFCPAVWLKHVDDGTDSGLGAFTHFDKIDNVNSLASHIDDYIHKTIESPKLVSAPDGKIEAVIGANKNTDGTITTTDPRLNWVVLMTQAGASVHDLSGLLKIAEASPELDRQLKSFSDDYPELQAHAIIKQNSQLSGAALERMLTPAQNRLDRAAANYNQQLVKLRQMQLAVGGWRYKNGWKMKTTQQSKFAPFDLSSYEKGSLDFQLKPSLLIQQTESEAEDVLKKKADRAAVMKEFVDKRETLRIAGMSEEEIDEILTRIEQAENRKQIEGGIPATVGGLPAKQLGEGAGA